MLQRLLKLDADAALTFARGDARARRSRGRGAVWALRRPPALGDAGDGEMGRAVTQADEARQRHARAPQQAQHRCAQKGQGRLMQKGAGGTWWISDSCERPSQWCCVQRRSRPRSARQPTATAMAFSGTPHQQSAFPHTQPHRSRCCRRPTRSPPTPPPTPADASVPAENPPTADDGRTLELSNVKES